MTKTQFETEKELNEQVILVGVATRDNEYDIKDSMDELEELAKTAGAITVEKIVQNREGVHPGTYLGKGKIEEVGIAVRQSGAVGIICDDELSPAQLKNLEEVLDCKVMDRTMLILDIFAKHAHTREDYSSRTCSIAVP